MSPATYKSYPDFFLRSPLLPVDATETIPNDLDTHFRVLLKEEYFKRALYLASPDFYKKVLQWQAHALKDPKEIQKILSTLLRYWLRMSTRCTPYGIFAGCLAGTSSNTSTSIVLDEKKNYHAYSRLDMNYLCELAHYIATRPSIRTQLLFYPNNSLYQINGSYRYLEYTLRNKRRNYFLREVEATEPLAHVLAQAHAGGTITTLAEGLISETILPEDAQAYVDELVDNQLLVSELEPAVTGDDYFSWLIAKVKILRHTEEIIPVLEAIQSHLKDSETGISGFQKIHALVSSLLPETSSTDLIQTDLFLAAHTATLPQHVVDDIVSTVDKLLPMMEVLPLPRQTNFIKKFSELYEDQEVSLLHVLDAELGIGYDIHANAATDNSELLEGFALTEARTTAGAQTWNKQQSLKLKMLQTAVRENRLEIILTDEDLQDLSSDTTVSPADSIYLYGVLLASDGAQVDARDYTFLAKDHRGPSAANFLGRFCHGNRAMTEKVRDYLREEESRYPDAVFAEVVHLPQSRAGNIISRPVLRSYEIPYLTRSGVPASQQIDVADLLVSVRKGQIHLRSKKLNKRVIPRLSSAHNYTQSQNLPVYKFLCDLQHPAEGIPRLWDWGPLQSTPFLPRVSYANVMLRRATWRIDAKHLHSADAKTYAQYIDEFRKTHRMPARIVLAEGDNELLLDLDHAVCREILVATLKKTGQVQVLEHVSTRENCFVEDRKGGKFAHEIIFPLKRVHTTPTAPSPRPLLHAADTQRTFAPGSEWLYLKLYCGTQSAEKILKEHLRPAVAALTDTGTIDTWFFLRYTDPGHHIRIRFHGPRGHWTPVLQQIMTALDPLLQRNVITKIQTDTYQRELERYGPAAIDLSETIFHADSEAVLNFIALLEDDSDETYRWRFALRGTDMLLDDFGLALPQKLALLSDMSAAFFAEFHGDKALMRQLDNGYREKMQIIKTHLDPARDEENEIIEAVDIFHARSLHIRPAAAQLHRSLEAQHATHRIPSLLSSYVHMYLNRLFISNQRSHELIIYHYLHKYYKSQDALRKQLTEALTFQTGNA